MRTYILKRLLLIVPTLLGAAALVFVIMRVIPGDVALLIFGGDQAGHIDPKQLAAMRQRLGLDQPLLRAVRDVALGRAPLRLRQLALDGAAGRRGAAHPPAALPRAGAPGDDGLGDHRHPPRHARRRPPGHLGGLRRPRGQHRRPGHPVVLGRDPLHPVPRDLLRLGAAARVHAAVGRSLGELPDDGLAGAHRRLSIRRRHHPHDAIDGARGAAGGLHPHRLGEGAARSGPSSSATP